MSNEHVSSPCSAAAICFGWQSIAVLIYTCFQHNTKSATNSPNSLKTFTVLRAVERKIYDTNRKVKPFLDELDGVTKWEVDVNNPQKILTVESEELSAEQIQEALAKAGYQLKEQ